MHTIKEKKMKLLYVLPMLLALPMGAFAKSDIRPFIGYDFSLASTSNVKIKQSGNTIVEADEFAFNDDNIGSFGLGVEFEDVMAIYVTPTFNKVKLKGGEEPESTEIDTAFNFYLTRGSNFKPFVSLNIGYISVNDNDSFKASGATFGTSIGCKQYISDNIYLFANAGYKFSTKMDVKKITGTPVTDAKLRISGFDLSIGAGYRF